MSHRSPTLSLRPHRGRHHFNFRRFGRNICVVRSDEAQSWRETFSKAPSQRSGQELQEIDKSLASRVEFFFKLPKSQRLGLYKVCKLVHVRKGEELFRQGDIGNTFYIILSGMVDVNVAMAKTHNIDDMAKIAALGVTSRDAVDFTSVATLGPMQTFGERALEDSDCKRKAAVVAVDDTWLLGITGDDYHMVQEEWRLQQILFMGVSLGQSSVFGAWSKPALAELATCAASRVVQPGESLVAQGDSIEDVFVITSGQCKVLRRLAAPAAMVENLETVGGALWMPDTEYEVIRNEDGSTDVAIALRHLGKHDVFGLVSAINLTPSRHSLVADTRVEVLVLHRDDVVSVIASGSAPTSTFQVACRVESCMFPSDEVILRRLTDEYNWKLYKYSLLQESLVKKDMSRPRELRRIHPGVLPKAASAARQYLPPSLSPRSKPSRPPETARSRRRGTRKSRRSGGRADEHIASVYGTPANKTPSLPPQDAEPNHNAGRTRRASQASDIDAFGNVVEVPPAAPAAKGAGGRLQTAPARNRGDAGSGQGMFMLSPLRHKSGDQAVLSRLPDAWKLQRREEEQQQWHTPKTPRRRAGDDVGATVSFDMGGTATSRPTASATLTSSGGKLTATRGSLVPRPPSTSRRVGSRGSELASRARLASRGRSRGSVRGLTVPVVDDGRDNANGRRRLSVERGRLAAPSSNGRSPGKHASASVSRRVKLASQRAHAMREKVASGGSNTPRGGGFSLDGFAERHEMRKRGRTRRQPSNRSLVSLSSATGSMFTVATMREELSLAMGLAPPDKPPLVRSIPRTPMQTSEIYRDFVSGKFVAEAFQPVTSLLPPSTKPATHRSAPPLELGGSSRSVGSVSRRPGNPRSKVSFQRRASGRKQYRMPSGMSSFGAGQINAIAEQSDDGSSTVYSPVVGSSPGSMVREGFVGGARGSDDDGTSDEDAENEIQDAYFEVFGVHDEDVHGRELTEEELAAAPRWWYKPKNEGGESSTHNTRNHASPGRVHGAPVAKSSPLARKAAGKEHATRGVSPVNIRS